MFIVIVLRRVLEELTVKMLREKGILDLINFGPQEPSLDSPSFQP
jgi:hypothetical protein